MALSIKHIAQMYCVNGKYFAGLYRNKLSGYAEWREDGLDCGLLQLSQHRSVYEP